MQRKPHLLRLCILTVSMLTIFKMNETNQSENEIISNIKYGKSIHLKVIIHFIHKQSQLIFIHQKN